MTHDEWETALEILNSGRKWEEMWQLAQAAPPLWSVRLLRQLKDAGWVPKTEFAGLVQMGQKCEADVPTQMNGSWRCQATLLHRHREKVLCLGISPDSKLFASASDDRTVRLWSLPDGKLLQTFAVHSDVVNYLAFSPDSKLLASPSRDKTVRLWTSGLCSLSRLPVEQMSAEDMQWVQEALQDQAISEAERDWLKFIQALLRWQLRFDVEVEEPPQGIDAREFDIEIEE